MKSVFYFILLLWSNAIKATEYCAGITPLTLKPSCFRADASDEDINCADPVSSGTMVRLSCNSGYKKPNENFIDAIFCRSGHWDYDPVQCEPICGRFSPGVKAIPWHALIVFENGPPKCEGTIINEKIIISAANCFRDKVHKKYVNITNVQVIVGRTQISHGTRLGNQMLFIRKKVFTEEGDIAILVLDRYIEFPKDAAPICIEWLNEEIVTNEFNGFIPVYREKDGKELVGLSNHCDCKNASTFDDGRTFKLSCNHSYDKEIIGFGDSGGGFFIKKVVNGIDTYFLGGVIIYVDAADDFRTNRYTMKIVNIRKHSAMILKYLNKYTAKKLYREFRGKQFGCEMPFIPSLGAVAEDEYNMKTNLSYGYIAASQNKITYTCERNHKLIGTTTNYCMGKDWAENHPVCIEAATKNTPLLPQNVCKKPESPNLIITHNVWAAEKEITEDYVNNLQGIRYKCQKHYHLVGILFNYCEHGKWRWRKHPTCLNTFAGLSSEESCEVPFIPNSIIIVLEGIAKRNISVGNYVQNGNTITYNCKENHTIHGPSSNYCYEGKWLAEHPTCVKLVISSDFKRNCKLPDILNGGTVIETVIKENVLSLENYVKEFEMIRYRCKKNYFLVGNSENTCGVDGNWFYDHSQCIKKSPNDCEVPTIPDITIILEGEIKKIISFGSYVENFNIISYICKENHILQGRNTNNCIRGKWTDEHPTCAKYCSSDILKGVTFSAICEFKGMRISCDQKLRVGTIAKIVCTFGYRKPNPFVHETILCDDFGHWDYEPFHCEPVCGIEYSDTTPFIKGGDVTNITAVPWHAAIYSSLKGRYSQICGGTIITAKLVLSAAHCFWRETNLIVNSSFISVGVGKYYRNFYVEEPLVVQFLNVSDIVIPEGYQGPLQAYHDDIAILILTNYIIFKPYIQPICIQWLQQEEKTIHSGVRGRIAGWGRTSLNLPSEELKMLDIVTLSYVDCINAADIRFRSQIAADKFCISSSEEESVCPGDSGGGFAIPQIIEGIKIYFLWGIVSNGLTERNDCNSVNLTTLTNIQHYYDLILHYQKKYRYK